MINYDDNLVKTDWGLEETVYPKTYGELNRVVIELIKQVVNMKGATSSADGTAGLVPAPAAGSQATKYLRADGTWRVPPDTKYTHPNSGVTAGTYKSVIVNAQGHVIGGSNPTTLSGYGITDAPTKTGSGASGTWGISVSGNAATATKATQDSAGQQINTTYIKGLSISGATITYTKGNGTTGTLSVPNFQGVVTQRGTRTSNGNWSITGLTVGKPLFIIDDRTGKSNAGKCYVRVISGAIGGRTNESYDIGTEDLSNIFIVIPTATTVVINCSAMDDETLYAYQ